MTEKAANYTPEQTAQMVQAYRSGVAVEAIASGMGKTVRSVIAKLSREGVYLKKEYVTKTGEKPITRDELATKIGEAFGLSEGEVDSLTKANKTALVKILDRVQKSN